MQSLTKMKKKKKYFQAELSLFKVMNSDCLTYPGTTSFRPPKKYFMLFYLLSSPIVLVIALYYLLGQEQQI